MVHDIPILVHHGNELVDQLWHIEKVGRGVISNVNGLLTKAPAKLRNIGNSGGVQRP